MKKACFFLLAVACSVLGDCGKNGPLVLQPVKQPLPIEEWQIRQFGTQIILEWSLPPLLNDNATVCDPKLVSQIKIYSADRLIPEERFIHKAEVAAKIRLEEAKKMGKLYSFSMPMKNKALAGKKYWFAITYEYDHRNSPLSRIRSLETNLPPRPITDLQIGQEGKVIFMRWSRPVQDIEGHPLPIIEGYNIYRWIKTQNLREQEFLLLNQEPVSHEYYEDKDTGADGEYFYWVVSKNGDKLESERSNIVQLAVKDIYPPDIPANLVSFIASDHIFLSWEAVTDSDLSNYRIFRRMAGEEEWKLLADDVHESIFRDNKVQKGKTYEYAVSAVDQKKNESEKTEPIRQKFE